MTKDLQLVCSHDQWIKDVCNVENFEEFSDRLASFWDTPYGMYVEKMKILTIMYFIGKQNFSYITKTVFIHMVATIHKRILFQSCRSLFEIYN